MHLRTGVMNRVASETARGAAVVSVMRSIAAAIATAGTNNASVIRGMTPRTPRRTKTNAAREKPRAGSILSAAAPANPAPRLAFARALTIVVRMRDKPSRTALKVAYNILSLSTKPGADAFLPAGIGDATARLLVSSGAASERMIRVCRSRWLLRLYERLDRVMPGQFVGFGQRKAFCEREVRRAIADGATQVLVLGAGYDTLCWRLAPEFPDVRFFEIDHPATAAVKARGIAAMGRPDNLQLIAEDLAQRALEDVLKGTSSWDRDAITVAVAEGLLMYLPEPAVRELFTQLAGYGGPGTRLAFTHVGTRDDGRPDAGPRSRLTLWSLELMGEPWRWSLRPERLDDFLSELGWRRVPAPEGAPTGGGIEHFAIAQRGRPAARVETGVASSSP